MPQRSRVETAFAIYSIVSALVHFTGETAYHVKWGQPLPMLLVDYIAISALLIAGTRSLQVRRTASAMGMLAGGWGFTFCLNWRAYFGRAIDLEAGRVHANGEPTWVMGLLGGLLLISGAAAVLSFALADPRFARPPQAR